MIRMRCLVTGANGFVGRHLVACLVNRGLEVIGIDKTQNLAEGTPSSVLWITTDLRNSENLHDVIAQTSPDLVFHLAGLIRGDSLEELISANVLCTRNVLESILRSGHRVQRVLVSTSCAEYGWVKNDDLPVSEDQPLCPSSLYGLSKAMQYFLSQQYYLRDDLPIVQTRAFNLAGPGEPPSLVCGAFAKQIAEIEAGLREPVLTVGNISTGRDFVDVRDAVEALTAVCVQGEVGDVYNICSGQPRSIGSIVRALIAKSNRSIDVVEDPSRFMKGDVPLLYGDPRHLRNATGWEPRIAFEQTLEDVLNYWREAVR